MIGFEVLASVAPILAFRGLADWCVPARRVSDRAKALSGFEIAPGVRIWYIPHNNNADVPHFEALPTPEDIAEFSDIRDKRKRDRSLTTRAVLRCALSDSVDGAIEPAAWRFARDEMGKPELMNGPETLSFSCSHSQGASIIAVSATRNVGIDIEAPVSEKSEQWLADTFTAEERHALYSLKMSEQAQAVTRLWTLKEAYLKMLGTGIAELLEVAFDPRNDRLLSGHSSRRAAASFQTWIVNCQGQPLSVAVAISDRRTKGAYWRQLIEECRGRSRAKFVPGGKRADKGTASLAPLLRSTSAAAAGASGG